MSIYFFFSEQALNDKVQKEVSRIVCKRVDICALTNIRNNKIKKKNRYMPTCDFLVFMKENKENN